MKDKSKKKGALSDQIASLFTVAPSADVEDDLVFRTKPKTVTKEDLEGSGSEDELAQLSSFRKQSAKLLGDISSRYAGEATSRKELGFQQQSEDDSEDDDDELSVEEEEEAAGSGEEASDGSEPEEDKAEEDDVVEDDESDQDATNGDLADSDAEGAASDDDNNLDEEDSNEEDEDNSSDAEGSQDGFDISQLQPGKAESGNFKHMEERNVSDEAKKGDSVRNQLQIWENLLEMRINLQRCVGGSNRLPEPPALSRLRQEGGEDFNTALGKTKGTVATLLTRLTELQTLLLTKYPETKNLTKNSKFEPPPVEDPMDEEIESDDSDAEADKASIQEKKPTQKQNRKRKLEDYSQAISDRHALYTKYRNSVIQKWNDKSRLTAGYQKNQPTVTSTLSQIEFILNDREKLIKRTQVKRSNYDRLCEDKKVKDDVADEDLNRKDVEQEYCSEIFDDDDFYHQLLRELIEHKSADVSDPVQLSRQWIALQQLRSKMKRKVDTRATKGRRIRYAVHSKLLNFMGPEPCLGWTDEAKDELYASLFGKHFENNTDHIKSKKSCAVAIEDNGL